MIQERYVSFEIAKLLKEKGLTFTDVVMYCMYDIDGNIHWGIYDKHWFPRVTNQTAMEWLRKKYKLLISIFPMETTVGIETLCHGIYRITENLYQPLYCGKVDNLVDSYEETVEAAIRYSLENLI